MWATIGIIVGSVLAAGFVGVFVETRVRRRLLNGTFASQFQRDSPSARSGDFEGRFVELKSNDDNSTTNIEVTCALDHVPPAEVTAKEGEFANGGLPDAPLPDSILERVAKLSRDGLWVQVSSAGVRVRAQTAMGSKDRELERWVRSATELASLVDLVCEENAEALCDQATDTALPLEIRRAAVDGLLRPAHLGRVTEAQLQRLLRLPEAGFRIRAAEHMTPRPVDTLLAMALDGAIPTSDRYRALQLVLSDTRTPRGPLLEGLHRLVRETGGDLMGIAVRALGERQEKVPLELLKQRYSSVAATGRVALAEAAAAHGEAAVEWALGLVEKNPHAEGVGLLCALVGAHGRVEHARRLQAIDALTPWEARAKAAKAIFERHASGKGGLALSEDDGTAPGGLSVAQERAEAGAVSVAEPAL